MERLVLEAIAARAWRNGCLVLLATAATNGGRVLDYIDPKWLKQRGVKS